MVAKTLAYHPTITHYVRFVATTVGRDKALRLVQFLARFLSFYLHRKGYAATAIAPWDAIKKQFAQARKVMRLGKNIEHFKAAAQALDARGPTIDPISTYLTAGRQLGYGGYLSLDILAFLDSSGIYKLPSTLAPRISRLALKLWLTGILFSLAHSFYGLRKLKKQEEKVEKTDAEGKVTLKEVEVKRRGLRTQLVCDGADLVIPAAGLGWVAADEGMVGLAGIVSSWIGLRGQWKRTAG